MHVIVISSFEGNGDLPFNYTAMELRRLHDVLVIETTDLIAWVSFCGGFRSNFDVYAVFVTFIVVISKMGPCGLNMYINKNVYYEIVYKKFL